MFHPEAPASPFFHPKGAVVYNELIAYVRGLYRKYGYDEVISPQIFEQSLFEQSGHLANYGENMYFARGGERLKNHPVLVALTGNEDLQGRDLRHLPLDLRHLFGVNEHPLDLRDLVDAPGRKLRVRDCLHREFCRQGA